LVKNGLRLLAAVMITGVAFMGACSGGVDSTIEITEEESHKVAEEFVKNSPTFVFDGMEDTLRMVDSVSLSRCMYCWALVFEFDSRQAGYGDRTGQMLAQVITPHHVVIVVERLEVASAVMDEKWDMLRQEMIAVQEKPIETTCVGELLASPVYDTEVVIRGEVSLLGKLLCPCFELTSCGETVQVWYGLMVENDGTERPAVSVEGIVNGDTVEVTGELKGTGGTHYSEGDFWAKNIVAIE